MSGGEATISSALTATAEELGVKVFVGNIAFSTTDEELKAAFQSVGEVLTAQVITRGRRSLGYAFVEFKDEAAATKAVSKFDKSQLNERTINVEIAKPAKHAPGGGVAKAAAEAAQSQGLGGDEGAASRRGRTRARRGGARRVQPDGEADGGADGLNGITDGVAALSTGEDGASRRGGRGRGRGGRGGGRGGAPRGPPQGEASSTLLFVANLPFQLDDAGLSEVFKAYKVTSAHVVTRKYGATAGRSKGFGFVEVANAQEQQRAVADLNGKMVETPAGNRELSVKIAIQAADRDIEDHEVSVTATRAGDAAANA